MGSVRRSLAVLVCSALVAPALGGCGSDEPEPIIADPPASETPSPSPTPSREPWEVRSKAGAVAFVEHWVEVFNEAAATGETRELRRLSAARCEACNGYAYQIDALYKEGGRIESEGWTLEGVGVSKRAPLRHITVGLQIRRSPELVVAGNGRNQRFPGGLANYAAEPRWSGGGWRLAALVNVS